MNEKMRKWNKLFNLGIVSAVISILTFATAAELGYGRKFLFYFFVWLIISVAIAVTDEGKHKEEWQKVEPD